MAYTKTTWVNGTAPAINATNLNNIETGIDSATTRLDVLEAQTSTAQADILTLDGRVDDIDALKLRRYLGIQFEG